MDTTQPNPATTPESDPDKVNELEMLITDFVLGLVGAELNTPAAAPLTMDNVTLVMTAFVLAGARLYKFGEHRNLDPFIRFAIVSYYHTHQANLATALEKLSENNSAADIEKLSSNLGLEEFLTDPELQEHLEN